MKSTILAGGFGVLLYPLTLYSVLGQRRGVVSFGRRDPALELYSQIDQVSRRGRYDASRQRRRWSPSFTVDRAFHLTRQFLTSP
jgi:hypothetical protein